VPALSGFCWRLHFPTTSRLVLPSYYFLTTSYYLLLLLTPPCFYPPLWLEAAFAARVVRRPGPRPVAATVRTLPAGWLERSRPGAKPGLSQRALSGGLTAWAWLRASLSASQPSRHTCRLGGRGPLPRRRRRARGPRSSVPPARRPSHRQLPVSSRRP